MPKGHTNNPGGRPTGSQNKLTATFKELLSNAIVDMQKGDNSLPKWAEANPTEFYKIASKVWRKTYNK